MLPTEPLRSSKLSKIIAKNDRGFWVGIEIWKQLILCPLINKNYNGEVSSKNVLVFLGYFIRIEKRNNFVEEFCSHSSPFSLKKLNLKIQKYRSFLFGRKKKERVVLLRKIEFSN
jgi:hypothetical protein